MRSDRRAGWAYLAVSINGAAYTLNAYRPARRSRLFLGWSFVASWITIELAPFHLVWQVLATALFARNGALRSRPGRIGLAVTVASWVGLAAAVRQSFAARGEIREALRELQHDEPWPAAAPVRVERHLAFARSGGRTLRLDVHLPDVPITPGMRRPALVQVHGGAWVVGYKDRQGQLLLRKLAEQGWVCFNVDYRLSPMATFPEHLIDVKQAIAWVREHAEDWGVDTDFVCITGGSAGGHLSSLAALTAGNPRYQPGFEQADTSVAAAVPFYGVYDFTNRLGAWPPEAIAWLLTPFVMKSDLDHEPEAWAAASPLDQVHADAPPFLVIHGDRDVLAPVEDAREFVRRLRAVSDSPTYYLELHGAQHAFEMFASIRSNAVVEAAARFLCAVHVAHERARTAAHEPERSVSGSSGRGLTDAIDDELGDEVVDALR